MGPFDEGQGQERGQGTKQTSEASDFQDQHPSTPLAGLSSPEPPASLGGEQAEEVVTRERKTSAKVEVAGVVLSANDYDDL